MANTTLIISLLPFVALLYLAFFDSERQRPKGTKYPPGPSRKPLIGNLLDIPPTHSWLQFKKWSDQYKTKILRLTMAGQEHYIISSERVANDLLRERGAIYSSRPVAPASAELLSNNLRPVLLPYNDRSDTWRNGRKFMHSVANAKVASQYHATQELESTRMIVGLIREPRRYEHWLELYSAAVVFRLAFGKRIETGEEEVVRRIMKVNHTLERVASPGAYLVDTFPILMKLPKFLAPFKKELQELHREEHSLFRGLLEDVRERMKNDSAPNCWERDFLEQQQSLDLTNDEGAYVVGTLFEAGSGTTAAAMMSFMLAMVLHPAWFRMLQAEVDQISEERLPTLDDVPQMPTVRAAVKETLRWHPVTSGGLPHVCTKDDIYEGFFIPAGTVVHPVQWAMHRDPELYPDPETYNPQRWLDPSYPTYKEPLTEHPNLHNYSTFGFGRRICPGQNIAERNLYLLAARIAWSVDLMKAKDETGKEITPPYYTYTAGFNSQPKRFPFDAKVRSASRQAIIDAEMQRHAENDPLK
ncbi:uncharacterized protein LTR77_010118 [Saxophila tyrrhenica]|uniref:Cytochrome P450 n=1 Tax=Saxophila tyrrhenica TaxID=1690608 RepID=A0AAV9NZB9_9PEZI|nr:hypothetical protein LTR77_010118 [Saxophila tyrrhenica]